jgi:hypothetical protein
MDFSVYEQRQIAEMERELAADRRLAAINAALGSSGPRLQRRLRCLFARLRHRQPAVASTWARVVLVASIVLTVALPALLIVALVLKLPMVAVAAVCVLPVAPVALVLAQDWAVRPRS